MHHLDPGRAFRVKSKLCALFSFLSSRPPSELCALAEAPAREQGGPPRRARPREDTTTSRAHEDFEVPPRPGRDRRPSSRRWPGPRGPEGRAGDAGERMMLGVEVSNPRIYNTTIKYQKGSHCPSPPSALLHAGTFLSCRFFTAAVWCVPALRVPLVHSLINHFRQNIA